MNTQKKASLNNEQQSQPQGSSNTQDKRESKYEKHDIEGTPFTVIEEPLDEHRSEYHVTLGKYRLNTYGNLNDAKIDAEEITWDKIIQVTGILIQADAEMQKQKINNLEVVE